MAAAVFELLTSVVSVHAEPFHNSTCVVEGPEPPTDIAAVVTPAAVLVLFAVFKSPTSVHAEPFHCSLDATGGAMFLLPAIAKAAVEVPAPPKLTLPTFKSPTSVR